MILQSFWALVAAFCFSGMGAFVRLCSSVDPIALVFFRGVFITSMLACFAISKRRSFRPNYWQGHLTRGSFGTLSQAIWFATLGMMPFGTNMTLTYTTALYIAVAMTIIALVRRESVPWKLVGSIALGFVGVVVIMRPTVQAGYALPAFGCLTVAFIDMIVYWQMRILGKKGEPTWRIVFYYSLCCTVLPLVILIVTGRGVHLPDDPQVLLYIVVVAAFAMGGLLSAARAWTGGNVLLVSCLGFSAIPFSELISWLAFDQKMDMLTLCGMAIIAVAGMCATVFTKQLDRRNQGQ